MSLDSQQKRSSAWDKILGTRQNCCMCALAFVQLATVPGVLLITCTGVGVPIRHTYPLILALVLVAGIRWHLTGETTPPIFTLTPEAIHPVFTDSFAAAW